MANSKDTAEKILAHLEASDKPGRGLNNAFGRVPRKQYARLVGELANIIDGKPAVEELPKTDAASKVTPTKPAGGNKPAQA